MLFSSDFTSDFPKEVPRLLIQSKDRTKKLQAGPSRIDLFVESENADEEVDVVGDLAWSNRRNLSRHYVEHTKARAVRLACVLTRRAVGKTRPGWLPAFLPAISHRAIGCHRGHRRL